MSKISAPAVPDAAQLEQTASGKQGGKRKRGPIKLTEAIESAAIETVEISRLKPAPYNPRKIDGSAMAGLTKSIERFGYVEPIIWNKRTGYVVGGHQRLKVLKTAKIKSVPVVVVDLDDAEEKALNLALNNPHIGGQFTEELQTLLGELRESIPNLFGPLRLDALLKRNGSESAVEYATRFEVVVSLDNETAQRELYERLREQGFRVKVMQL